MVGGQDPARSRGLAGEMTQAPSGFNSAALEHSHQVEVGKRSTLEAVAFSDGKPVSIFPENALKPLTSALDASGDDGEKHESRRTEQSGRGAGRAGPWHPGRRRVLGYHQKALRDDRSGIDRR